MGSRMANEFVFEHPNSGLYGLIVAGCRDNGGVLLVCDENLDFVTIPVLDIWGSKNIKDSKVASPRSAMLSSTYTQIEIIGNTNL